MDIRNYRMIVVLLLLLSSGALMLLVSPGNIEHRKVISGEFQHLLGGLTYSPSTDQFSDEASDDPRLDNRAPLSFGLSIPKTSPQRTIEGEVADVPIP